MLLDSLISVWLLMLSQLALLIGQVFRRQVTGIGGFILMSFLFFGIRPLYILIENDWSLFDNEYYLSVTAFDISDAMFWASLGLWLFSLAAFYTPRATRRLPGRGLVLTYSRYFFKRREKNKWMTDEQSCSRKNAIILVGLQLTTLPIMYVLAKSGRQLYTSSFGAYIYDFPMVLQSLNVFSLVFLFKRLMKANTIVNLFLFIISAFLFLLVSWLMRDLSLFRGFYLTGIMIAGISILQLVRRKSTFTLLIVGVLVLQPFFQYLGQDRSFSNADIGSFDYLERVIGDNSLTEAYWRFYDGRGDMNIFDTFLAAKKYEPEYRPYLWSWLYVPLHLVPRSLWKQKPIGGTTQDMSFTNGAPTSPGIIGFFLLDGGLGWMLGSMAVLGSLLSFLDEYILTMPRGNLQAILIGIVSVNAMFLSRFFLWQYFYQMLYSFVIIIILSRWLARREYIAKNAKLRRIMAIDKIQKASKVMSK